MFAARHVVEENHLRVLVAPFNLFARSVIAWVVVVRVHTNDFAVTLVPEQQALVGVSIGPKVG